MLPPTGFGTREGDDAASPYVRPSTRIGAYAARARSTRSRHEHAASEEAVAT